MKDYNYTVKTRLVISGFVIALISLLACNSDNSGKSSLQETDTAQVNVPPKMPDGQVIIRGIIEGVSTESVQIKTSDSTIELNLQAPFHLYSREASVLSNVKSTSYIGVTTHRQPDGTELAAEIHIFPDELRGLNEGSNVINKSQGSSPSRMTNGSISGSENAKAEPQSRMSNGNVTASGATSLEVQFQGHTKKVTVPPDIPITEFKLFSEKLTPGMKVDFIAKKGDDGLFSSGKGILQKN